jgi:hypothetical protein
MTDNRLQNELIDARYAARVKAKENAMRAQLVQDGIVPAEPEKPVAPISQTEAMGGNPSASKATSSTAVGPQDVKYAAGAESAMANGWNGVMASGLSNPYAWSNNIDPNQAPAFSGYLRDVKQNASDEDVASAMSAYGFNPDGEPTEPASTDASTDSNPDEEELTEEQLDPNHPSYVGHAAAAEYRNYQNNNAVRSQNWLDRTQDTAMTLVPLADEGLRVGDSLAKYGLGKTVTGRGNVSGLNSGAAKGAMQRTFGVTGKGAGAVVNKGMVGLNLYEAGAEAINELTGRDFSLFSEGKFGAESGMKGLRSSALGGNRLAGASEAVGNNLTAGGYDAVRANMGVLGDLPMPRSWSQAIKKNANAYTAQRGGAVNADPFGSGRLMESLSGQVFDAYDEWKNPRPKKPVQPIRPEQNRVVANNTTYGGNNFKAY